MRKLIGSFLTAALISVMSTAVFAAGSASAPEQQPGAVNSAESKPGYELKTSKAEFKSLISPLKAERKSNREENVKLREQNKLLLEQVNTRLSELKANDTKLTAEQKEGFKAIKAELKSVRAEIQSTKGQIQAILDANIDNRKDMNLEAVQAAYSQIFQIQSDRHDRLIQINSELGKMLALIG